MSDKYEFTTAKVFHMPRQKATICLYEAKGGIGCRITQQDAAVDIVMPREFWDQVHFLTNYTLREIPLDNIDKVAMAIKMADIKISED